MDVGPSIAVDLGPTYGAAFVGLVVEASIFGVTLLQTYDYYKNYSRDSLAMKWLVAALTLLDTLHLILCARTIYWYLVTNFGASAATLDEITWSMALQTDCNGIIGVSVQIFFARRVWMMSRNWFLTILIVILGTIHFSLGVVFTVQSFVLGRFSRFSSLLWITCTGLGSAAAADILIAISMCYYLAQKRTGIARTDSLVTTLMIYSINTGLLTSILATCSVIMFAVMPTNFVWLSFFWIMGKCYVNSFLASLNSREGLRSKVYASAALEISQSRRRNDIHLSPVTRKPSTALAVSIQTTTEYKTDYDGPDTPTSAAYPDQHWASSSSGKDGIHEAMVMRSTLSMP